MAKKFLSMDPSLANTAIVWGEIESDELRPIGYTLIRTKKGSSKKVRAASDTIRRAKEVIEKIKKITEIVKPDVCFGEIPSGSQSSNAMKSYGLSCAYLAMLVPPPIEVTPTHIKKEVNGTNSASKEEIINFVTKMFPDFPMPKNKKGVIIKCKAEHVADAIMAAVAGMRTTQYKQIKKFLN